MNKQRNPLVNRVLFIGITTAILMLFSCKYDLDNPWDPESELPGAATPTFSPEGGTYTGERSVTISCATANAEIFYTTDGSIPTGESNRYTGAVSIGTTMTIKAVAVASGYSVSGTGSATYAIESGPNSYTIRYDGNGADGGSAPVDNTEYREGDEVTVLGNTGALVKTGYSFSGWNTEDDGSGTTYIAGQTFAMGTSGVALYARWTEITGPEINIKQGATDIPSGGSYNFGNVTSGSSTSADFTIENPGTANLNLTGDPRAVISGADASEFSVTAQPSSPVAAGGTTTFTVSFSPQGEGLRTATVTIENNDSDEGAYLIYWGGNGISSFTGLSPVDGSTVSSATPILSWNAVDGAERYEVQIAETEADLESAALVTTGTNSYTPTTALTSNTTYYWRVRTVDDGQATAWSATCAFNVTQVVLTVSSDGSGTTTPSGEISIDLGVSVSIEASPAEHCRFDHWSVESGSGVTFADANDPATTVSLANGDAVIRANFIAWPEIDKLLASDGAAGDRFGLSVAISGDYAIVGARDDDDSGEDSGSAYIFSRSGDAWTQQVRLLPSDGAAGDNFGRSVSISGEYALVGASDDDNNAGSAYIFYRNGTSWSQQAKLYPSNGAQGTYFGRSVSISGDYALASTSAAAYIFIRSETSWTQQAKLSPPEGDGNSFFGESVSLSGDYALVGSPYADDDLGSAYIFHRSGTNWPQQAKLTASDRARDDDFGASVSISGDYAIVGADSNDDNGTDSGSAYIFQRNGTFWTQQVKLLPSDGVAEHRFGDSVSISGDYALVGAYGDDDNGSYSGSAYIFHRNGTSWTQQTKLTASDWAAGDYFGGYVAISGNYIIVGASRNDTNGTDAGAAYIFGGE